MVAVIEMINKLEEPHKPSPSHRRQNTKGEGFIQFSEQDELVLSKFADVVAGTLSNSLIYNELEQHTDMVEGTLQGITSYIITLDKNGKLKSTNHPLDTLFGISEEEMRLSSYTSWIPDGINDSLKRNIGKVFETSDPVSRKNETIKVRGRNISLTVSYQIMPLRVDGAKRKRYTSRKTSSVMSSAAASAAASVVKSTFESPSPYPIALTSKSGTSISAESVSGGEVVEIEVTNSLQGVVIVMENVTEGRLRQTAIQRYQRRLNEMENQMQEFSELKNKLQGLDIADLEDAKPETTRALANLALCLNTPLIKSGKKMPLSLRSPNSAKSVAQRGQNPRNFSFENRTSLSPKALRSWNWNVLDIDDPQLLKHAICVMFDELRLNEQWAIPAPKLDNMITSVMEKYRDVPFHNFKHGISVTQTTFYLITCTELRTCLDSIQAFALIISALCHDIDHPGHTNGFEVNSNSDLALLYNDTSVLENHHCATAGLILRKEENNILSGLEMPEFREFRSYMCNSILATDMSSHFSLLGRFRDAIHMEGGWNPEQSADKLLLVSIVLHAADLSNPCKPWEACERWSNLVSEEFNEQVKMEKRLGLPFLPFMECNSDKEKATQERSFIEFIIEPMWKDVVEFLPQLDFCLDHIKTNKENWKSRQDAKI